MEVHSHHPPPGDADASDDGADARDESEVTLDVDCDGVEVDGDTEGAVPTNPS